jgi:phosphatidate cytidylyltransferase
LRFGLKRDVGHAWRSYRSWLVMVPLVLSAIFLGRIAFVAFVGLLSILGFREFARATGLSRDRALCGVVYAGIVAVGVVSLTPDPRLSVTGWYGMFMVLPVYVVAAILLIPILRNRSQGQLQSVSLAALGFLYIGWMFGHLAFLANANPAILDPANANLANANLANVGPANANHGGAHAYGYLLFLIFAVELNDIAAFTFGRLLGRHPLRNNISPKKTWEGALGALAVSLALPWLLWFCFPHFSPRELVLTGLIVGVGGQLGDLSISLIKRDLGVKDMGAAISGHGGILDRIDSMIYVAPLFFHMVRWFHDL